MGIEAEINLGICLGIQGKMGMLACDVCLGGHYYMENIPHQILDAGIPIPS
jgi:hypothetical protein